MREKIICCVTTDISIDFFRGIIINLRDRGYEMIALSSPGDYILNFGKELSIPIIGIPMKRHISLWKDLNSLFKLIKVFKKESPHVVHSMTPKAGLLCMIASKIVGVPIRIHTFTGLVWPTSTGLLKRVLMLTDGIICRCATHIIPEGEGVKKDLHEHITKKEMQVLGYGNVLGVDMDLWNPLRFNTIDKSKDRFLFLFTGRIVGDKGINELVWAFSQLYKKYPETSLMLTGIYEKNVDPLLPKTDELIKECEAIVVNGPYSGDDLIKLYAEADCFLMPSYREGFPNSVLEAGAMGLPQIVTDINGSREIIIDGENGLIVPSRNKEALFEAMQLIYEDDRLREKLKIKARDLIASRFERSFVQQCQVDFYMKLLEA